VSEGRWLGPCSRRSRLTDAFLEIRSGASDEVFPLVEAEGSTVGRALGSGLTIDDPRVSRVHARIQRTETGWCIRDLGSRNGTLVNGQLLITERLLHDQDEIRVGDTTIHFREPGGSLTAITLPFSVLAPDGQGSSNAFIREGEFWSLSYGGTVVRLKDTKGLRDLAQLLASPGREVAAVDLARGGRRDAPVRVGAFAESGLSMEGDAGEAIDADARAQYRARLIELEDEISEAEAANDLERASRGREEREFLLAELGAAVGLGGRPRRALDPAERARKAVTWRVRDAINHIERAHAQLGRHLRRSIRTGSLCVYDPPEDTTWRL
jgi:hypothetical protein